jgi:hypothetical protein
VARAAAVSREGLREASRGRDRDRERQREREKREA